jgi:hypothetical protein
MKLPPNTKRNVVNLERKGEDFCGKCLEGERGLRLAGVLPPPVRLVATPSPADLLLR